MITTVLYRHSLHTRSWEGALQTLRYLILSIASPSPLYGRESRGLERLKKFYKLPSRKWQYLDLITAL